MAFSLYQSQSVNVHTHQLHLLPTQSERAMAPEVRRQRDSLELDVEALRARRSSYSDEGDYYDALEQVMLRLAHLYESEADAGDE